MSSGNLGGMVLKYLGFTLMIVEILAGPRWWRGAWTDMATPYKVPAVNVEEARVWGCKLGKGGDIADASCARTLYTYAN